MAAQGVGPMANATGANATMGETEMAFLREPPSAALLRC